MKKNSSVEAASLKFFFCSSFLQLRLVLEQRLEFLSQHDIAFDFQLALHVGLLGIQLTSDLNQQIKKKIQLN